MGLYEKSNIAYLIDYGLAKRYMATSNKFHIPFSNNKRMVGTLRYSSINSQIGYELSRRDDLESLGYCMVYMLKGKLPWQGIPGATKEEKHDRVLEKKQEYTIDRLCDGLPIEVGRYMYYCKNLQFEEIPNYSQLHKLFKQVLKKIHTSKNFEYDWNAMRCDLSQRTHKHDGDSNKAECEIQPKPIKLNMSRKIELMNLASGINLDIYDNAENNKKVDCVFNLIPEEEKMDIIEVNNKEGVRDGLEITKNRISLYSKHSKTASQGSIDKATETYKFFQVGNSGFWKFKKMRMDEADELMCDFRPSDITERTNHVNGNFNSYLDETIPSEKTWKDYNSMPKSYDTHHFVPSFRISKAINSALIKRAATHSKNVLSKNTIKSKEKNIYI